MLKAGGSKPRSATDFSAFCRAASQKSLCPGDQHLKEKQIPRGPINSPPPTAGAAPIARPAAAACSSSHPSCSPATPTYPALILLNPSVPPSPAPGTGSYHHPDSSDSPTALTLKPGTESGQAEPEESHGLHAAMRARGKRIKLAIGDKFAIFRAGFVGGGCQLSLARR